MPNQPPGPPERFTLKRSDVDTQRRSFPPVPVELLYLLILSICIYAKEATDNIAMPMLCLEILLLPESAPTQNVAQDWLSCTASAKVSYRRLRLHTYTTPVRWGHVGQHCATVSSAQPNSHNFSIIFSSPKHYHKTFLTRNAIRPRL